MLEGISALRRHPRTQLSHLDSHSQELQPKSRAVAPHPFEPTAPRGQVILGPGPEFRSNLGTPPAPLPEPGWELVALSS